MHIYIQRRCEVDTTCPIEYFVQPDTKDKLTVNTTEVGVTVSIGGKCHDKEVVLMNVTCMAVPGGRGVWRDESYYTCETDLSDQLTNLLEVKSILDFVLH